MKMQYFLKCLMILHIAIALIHGDNLVDSFNINPNSWVIADHLLYYEEFSDLINVFDMNSRTVIRSIPTSKFPDSLYVWNSMYLIAYSYGGTEFYNITSGNLVKGFDLEGDIHVEENSIIVATKDKLTKIDANNLIIIDTAVISGCSKYSAVEATNHYDSALYYWCGDGIYKNSLDNSTSVQVYQRRNDDPGGVVFAGRFAYLHSPEDSYGLTDLNIIQIDLSSGQRYKRIIDTKFNNQYFNAGSLKNVGQYIIIQMTDNAGSYDDNKEFLKIFKNDENFSFHTNNPFIAQGFYSIGQQEDPNFLCFSYTKNGATNFGRTYFFACNPGYVLNSQNTSCEPCPSGMYKTGFDFKVNCDFCPENSKCEAEGFQCNPGYKNITDNTDCLSCDAGYYKDQYGNWNCTECPYGATCDKKSEYVCQPGFGTREYYYGCQACYNPDTKAEAGNIPCDFSNGIRYKTWQGIEGRIFTILLSISIAING